MVPAAERMRRVSVQVGAPLQVGAKSLPATSGAEAGVTPAAWKTRAVIWVGAASQVPPVAPSGSRSVTVRFQAGEAPMLWTSSVKVSGVPIVIWAGPLFSSVRPGSTTVIGG